MHALSLPILAKAYFAEGKQCISSRMVTGALKDSVQVNKVNLSPESKHAPINFILIYLSMVSDSGYDIATMIILT